MAGSTKRPGAKPAQPLREMAGRPRRAVPWKPPRFPVPPQPWSFPADPPYRKPPRVRGFSFSRPVSRILSRVTIHLCGYPAPRRAASSEPVHLAPDGVWRAGRVATSAGGLLPHRFTLAVSVSGDALPAVCSLCHFPSAFAASLTGASCPAVSGLSSSPRRGPRSPGLRPGFYLVDRRRRHAAHRCPAFGAADGRTLVQDELPAHRAFERRAAQQREKLLLERPVQRSHAHSSRNTPTTRPSSCTWSA